jgi:hypothetical protein
LRDFRIQLINAGGKLGYFLLVLQYFLLQCYVFLHQFSVAGIGVIAVGSESITFSLNVEGVSSLELDFALSGFFRVQ